jgi:hypothetical protein
MTRLTIEHFEPPSTRRAVRVRDWAGERAADELAGRTVWGAAASPRGRTSARTLGGLLRHTAGGLSADPLEVDVIGGGPLRALADRLDAMLTGGSTPADLGAEEAALAAAAAADAEALIGRAVGSDDVVVVHDALTALLVQAVRERGAHTVWHVHVPRSGAPDGARAVREAQDFLHGYTAAVDAYIMTWPQPAGRGRLLERVAAAMPSCDVVATKEVAVAEDPDAPRRTLAWRTALADVVTDDRAGHVGGTVRVRPSVAAR